MTLVQLELHDNTTENEWAQLGHTLCHAQSDGLWDVGDWATFGEKKWDALKSFCELNGWHYQHMRELAYVAERIPLNRRHPALDWNKHREVAELTPKDQQKWLNKAERDKLTVSELRQQIRLAQGEFNALISDGPAMHLGSKPYADLKHWLQKRPKDFWTDDMRGCWLSYLDELRALIP